MLHYLLRWSTLQYIRSFHQRLSPTHAASLMNVWKPSLYAVSNQYVTQNLVQVTWNLFSQVNDDPQRYFALSIQWLDCCTENYIRHAHFYSLGLWKGVIRQTVISFTYLPHNIPQCTIPQPILNLGLHLPEKFWNHTTITSCADPYVW